MTRKTYTVAQRKKMLVVALGLCPKCEVEFDRYANVAGRDVFSMIREVVWKWFGQWDHGSGCPPEAFEVSDASAGEVSEGARGKVAVSG